ncbi:DUF262 domain-containing protein [Candidatus Parabeggiatoa sp. HSG14]|uniref:DUF262 domain-containing protein n=1 Tax=Candidatus Parabeggiatoa sp. HSG14 TaxID=3055593 RepID=UPI0025A7F065|nr:DUF262 domain-containing protein [Thiotrichales bacterium HSG14]
MQDDELMEIEEETEEFIPEDIVSPFDPKDIDIVAEQNSLSTIISMIEDDAIDLNTEFQRKGNLWNDTTMSQLVESILLRFPLPAFYFDASNDEKWLVVDGLQRLWTFKKFVIDKSLILNSLLILNDFNGKGYNELNKTLKRRMDRYQVITYLIKPGTPKRVKYDIFRRINTGGLVLTRQEIRHVLNQGKSAKYLKKLVENKCFEDIIRISDKRMQARELVLRYLAFSMIHYTGYSPNFISFLDKAMENLANLDDKQQEQLENNLWKALQICQQLFGEHIFSKSIVSGKQKLNGALFEVWTTLIGELNSDEIECLLSKKHHLTRKFKSYLKKESFLKSISVSISSKSAVIRRFETVESLIKEYTS